MSVAQGLAWSQNLPVHGFCSLTAQVYSAGSARLLEDGDRVLSSIDAQIDQLYGLWGTWQGEQFIPDAEAFICSPEELLNASSHQPSRCWALVSGIWTVFRRRWHALSARIRM